MSSWPLRKNDFAYATDEQVVIHDITRGNSYHVNLDFTFNNPEIQGVFDAMRMRGAIQVNFAVDAVGNKVYVLPFGTMEWMPVVYALDLDTGEVRASSSSTLSD
jgi:hypothetical protein